ncbi:MAG TPA: hypothetical protein VK610_05985 [Rhodothermales bacterium]|nr:hypothetical protein [Rhodothermales bacterium]
MTEEEKARLLAGIRREYSAQMENSLEMMENQVEAMRSRRIARLRAIIIVLVVLAAIAWLVF